MNQDNKTTDNENFAYGPSPESTEKAFNWLAKSKNNFGHFIGGKFTNPKNTFKTLNPATGKVLARLSNATEEDVKKAVKSGKSAFKTWKNISSFQRAKYIYALARLIQKNSRILAVLETLDNGKPIRESRDIDIPLATRHFYHHAGWAKIYKHKFPGKEPLGVIGQIIPWNFPLLMLAWKIAPALATGNTVVLKPAETTSLTALFFAELCIEAKIPAGVVNIVTGDGKTGSWIANHKDISKIAFTGSTEVGRLLRKNTAGEGKKITLELGGKSAFLVFEDADLDSAIEGVVDSIWFNQGEVCCAGSRLLVQEGIQKNFLSKLKRRMERLHLGNPLDKSTDIGAINSSQQLAKIKDLVASGEKEGAKIYQPKLKMPTEGFFYPPTLLEETHQSMDICQTEIFGPVLTVIPFRTPKEAVAIANNSRYGLSASIWTENINLGLDIAPRLKVGVVWINSTNLFDASAGFGGYRESGYGREGGMEGLREYLTEPIAPEKNKSKKTISKHVPPALPKQRNRIDRTRKLFIDGKQKRSDSGYDRKIFNSKNELIGQVPEGNRKDIRDAVEAATQAGKWKNMTAHNRAQILYYAAENLELRKEEFSNTIQNMTGKDGRHEVESTLETIFHYAAWADKFEGIIHDIPIRGVSLALNEPIGVLGIVCPDKNPLLSFVHLVFSALCTGNNIVAIPSERFPLCALDLYQIFESSDMPAGTINIITGEQDSLTQTLASHMGVDALWYFGDGGGSKMVEKLSISNLKQTWVNDGQEYKWIEPFKELMELPLYKGTQVKNVWIPYGE